MAGCQVHHAGHLNKTHTHTHTHTEKEITYEHKTTKNERKDSEITLRGFVNVVFVSNLRQGCYVIELFSLFTCLFFEHKKDNSKSYLWISFDEV